MKKYVHCPSRWKSLWIGSCELKPGHQDAPGGALEPSPAIPSRPIQHSTTNCRKYSNIIFQPIIQPMIQLYPTQKQFASPGGRFVPPGIVDSRCNDHGPGVQKIRTLWNCCVFPIWMSQSNDVKWWFFMNHGAQDVCFSFLVEPLSDRWTIWTHSKTYQTGS